MLRVLEIWLPKLTRAKGICSWHYNVHIYIVYRVCEQQTNKLNTQSVWQNETNFEAGHAAAFGQKIFGAQLTGNANAEPFLTATNSHNNKTSECKSKCIQYERVVGRGGEGRGQRESRGDCGMTTKQFNANLFWSIWDYIVRKRAIKCISMNRIQNQTNAASQNLESENKNKTKRDLPHISDLLNCWAIKIKMSARCEIGAFAFAIES